MCGDSHQIVPPNFFSWAQVRALFWAGVAGEATQHQNVQVLQANYRNSPEVTALANRLLQVKQSRFGSVDRERNFLVRSVGDTAGLGTLLSSKDSTLRPLDQPSRQLFARSAHGHYLPNPRMSLRVGEAWVPVYELLNANWVHQGHASTFASLPHADWCQGGDGPCFAEDKGMLPF